MAKIDTTDRFPWNEITDVTDTYLSDCVRIPKIFVKNSVDENGLITRMISNVKLKGYHCHPAFMQDGHERNAILIQKTTPSTQQEKTFSESQSAINALNNQDFHMYNIFEHSLLSLLALIEYGTTNLHEVYIDNYHGIILADNDDIWLDGIDTNGTNGALRIFDNLGNFTLQDTDFQASTITNGFPAKLATNSGDFYDFKDIFIGDSQSFMANHNQGSFGDYQDVGTVNGNFIVSAVYIGNEHGAFHLAKRNNITTAAYRMAKFAD